MVTGDSSFVTRYSFCAGHFRISVSHTFFHPPAQIAENSRERSHRGHRGHRDNKYIETEPVPSAVEGAIEGTN